MCQISDSVWNAYGHGKNDDDLPPGNLLCTTIPACTTDEHSINIDEWLQQTEYFFEHKAERWDLRAER